MRDGREIGRLCLQSIVALLMKAENRQRFLADERAYLDEWPHGGGAEAGDGYWQPLFAGFEFSRRWIAQRKPDVIFLVYNDHATAFDLNLIPTFAIGCGDEYEIADEGWGPRPVPKVVGAPDLAWHIRQAVIQEDFASPRSATWRWTTVSLCRSLSCSTGPMPGPVLVVPFAVNVIVYPPPSARRCFELGKAIRRAIDSFEADLDVQVWGTGGMSHQLQGPRAGFINQEFDARFLDALVEEPERLCQLSLLDYMRQAGSEGVELVIG